MQCGTLRASQLTIYVSQFKVYKKYKENQTGAKRWNQTVPMDKTNWTKYIRIGTEDL